MGVSFITKDGGYKFQDVIKFQIKDALIDKIFLEIPYYAEHNESIVLLTYIDITGIIEGAGIDLEKLSTVAELNELPSVCEEVFVNAVPQLDKDLAFPGYVYNEVEDQYIGILDVTIEIMCSILNIKAYETVEE